jgi:hypothetical protein
MGSFFLDAASEIAAGSWLQVRYNSARSDERKEKSGKVIRVKVPMNGDRKIVMERADGQRMSIYADERVISHGSHFPVTGYWTDLEVAHGDSS